MLLQPRKFKRKNKQKGRSFLSFRKKPLNYGDSGLLLLQPLRITAKTIFRLKLSLKKATKRAEFTRRLIWFNSFPHLPLSRKSKGIRMGKGVGKLANWMGCLKGGTYLFELKNLRLGRSLHFFKQAAFKLPVQTRIVRPQTKSLKLVMTRGTQFLNSYFY